MKGNYEENIDFPVFTDSPVRRLLQVVFHEKLGVNCQGYLSVLHHAKKKATSDCAIVVELVVELARQDRKHV